MRHQKVLRCGIKRCALRPSALRVRARAVRHRRGIASGERGQALGDFAAHRGRGGRSRGRLRRRGQPEHLVTVFREAHADAAIVAGMIHTGDYTLAQIKEEMHVAGVPIRLRY